MSAAEQYHVEVKHEGHPDENEDRAYRDLDVALQRAEEKAAALRANGYLVEQTSTGNDDIGIIREHHATERDGTPIATIEVRRCHEDGHI